IRARLSVRNEVIESLAVLACVQRTGIGVLIKIIAVLEDNGVTCRVAHDELAVALKLRIKRDELSGLRDEIQPACATFAGRLPAAIVRRLRAVRGGNALDRR